MEIALFFNASRDTITSFLLLAFYIIMIVML